MTGGGWEGIDSVDDERIGMGGGAVRGGTTGTDVRGRRVTSGVEPRLESELTSAGDVRGISGPGEPCEQTHNWTFKWVVLLAYRQAAKIWAQNLLTLNVQYLKKNTYM